MAIEPKDLLKAIGYDLKNLEADAKIEDLVTAYHDSQKAHYLDIFKNSDEFKAELDGHEGKAYGKWQDILNKAIKKAGLELTPEQQKAKPQEKIDLLSQHLATQHSGSKEIGDLQAQVIDWKNKYTDLEKNAEERVSAAMSEADKKVIKDKTQFHLKNKFISIPKEKLIGSEHLDIHWIGLEAKLNEKYDISFDEKGEFVFYKKGTQQKAEGLKDGRTVILTADEIITGQLKENKSWVESNGQGQQGQQNQQQRQQQTQTTTKQNNASGAVAARQKELEALVNQ